STPDLEASKTDTAPIATSIIAGLGETWGNVYLYLVLGPILVWVTAIQGATVRLLFSMGRDGRVPLGSMWGQVNSSFKTPANAAGAVGVVVAFRFFITASPR